MTRKSAALVAAALLALSLGPVVGGEDIGLDPASLPAIRAFVGEGLGSLHEEAPPEVEQFGRLAGVWRVDQELRRRDGEWVPGEPGIWVWKYTVDGFAVQDLWFQSGDNLPVYMANLNRDYLLTAMRLFDVSSGKWQVAWMANGAGKTPGGDFGTFTVELVDDEIVMTSPPGPGAFGLQRVIYYDIREDSFRWRSDYSADEGKTWNTAMRMLASWVSP